MSKSLTPLLCLCILVFYAHSALATNTSTNITSNTSTTTLVDGSGSKKTSLTDAINEIEFGIMEINNKLSSLKKFRDYATDIERELELIKSKTYIQSLNKTDLEALAYGYILEINDHETRLKDEKRDCEVRITRKEESLQKEIDILRHDKETLETLFGCSIVFYLFTLVLAYRKYLGGR